jgi:hypothetical protein
MADEPRYKEEHTSPACPHLKLAWDDAIRYSYPDAANCCYKPNKVRAVSLTYQEQVCLTAKFRECPIFALHKQGALPRSLGALISDRKKKRYDAAAVLNTLVQVLFVAGIVCVGVGMYLILIFILNFHP